MRIVADPPSGRTPPRSIDQRLVGDLRLDPFAVDARFGDLDRAEACGDRVELEPVDALAGLVRDVDPRGHLDGAPVDRDQRVDVVGRAHVHARAADVAGLDRWPRRLVRVGRGVRARWRLVRLGGRRPGGPWRRDARLCGDLGRRRRRRAAWAYTPRATRAAANTAMYERPLFRLIAPIVTLG